MPKAPSTYRDSKTPGLKVLEAGPVPVSESKKRAIVSLADGTVALNTPEVQNEPEEEQKSKADAIIEEPTSDGSTAESNRGAANPQNTKQADAKLDGKKKEANFEPLISGEAFLVEMLAAMDQHQTRLRDTQQGLVATVELACRRALNRRFSRLELVGSAALRVETPGSDVDVVCFTRKDGADDSPRFPVVVLRKVHAALVDLIHRYPTYAPSFSMELIDDARVPILRVLWGPAHLPIAVDVSVDQTRPVDHVRWFQRVGAAPRPNDPAPPFAPVVTLTLRCIKWWLRQRQIPRTKEGGLPTLAWLLMAVHVCSLPETHKQAIASSSRPMSALLCSLGAFFSHYCSLERLDGVLSFALDGSASEFRRRTERASSEPWVNLAVLDPTREGSEKLNLAPRLTAATQLLLGYELQRANARLSRMPRNAETTPGQSRLLLQEVFEPLPTGANALPTSHVHGLGIFFLRSEGERKNAPTVEVGIIDKVVTRPGWVAPFCLRSDDRSEIRLKVHEVDPATGRCSFRKSSHTHTNPCNFISRAFVTKDGRGWILDSEGRDRYRFMSQYVRELFENRQKGPRLKANIAATQEEHINAIPSPSRAAERAKPS